MKPMRDIEFKGVVEGRTHSDGRKVYRAVATTPALDRYGEVVLPRGAELTNFLANPVLVELHNYAKSSIGQVVDIRVTDASIEFDFVFSRDTRGQELEQKYQDGDMRAFSIGFKGKGITSLWYPWEDQPEIKAVTVPLPDGSTCEVDLTRYEQVPYRIYHKWELLEISPVTVPANPEALLLREAEDIIRRVSAANPVMRSFIQEDLGAVMLPLLRALEDFETRVGDGATYRVAGAVPTHSTPIEEGTWSGSDARAALAKWASKDGSGDKEKINWAKYRKGFAWFDSADAETFSAYKLPHHTVKDGELVAVWRGVTVAMSALLGARGGVELDDKDAVYRHLARHYKDFGKEAPEMKDYEEAELKAIAEADLVTASVEDHLGESVETTAGPAAATTEAQVAGVDAITDQIQRLAGSLKDLTETVHENFASTLIRLSILSDIVEEKTIPPKVEAPVEKKVEGEFTVSRETLEALDRLAEARK